MNRSDIVEAVCSALVHASTHLEPALLRRLEDMRQVYAQRARFDAKEAIGSSLAVLDMIVENLRIADERSLPLCQDTGMVVAFVDFGKKWAPAVHEIQDALNEGIEKAARVGYFRDSVVSDPVFERINTCTNLPAMVYWQPVAKDRLTISLLLKGFGSENCSGVAMLSPTANEKGIVEAVLEIVRQAGGKPCPPIVVGIGIGGTMEQAALLSKRALLREVGKPHEEGRYRELEKRILKEIQTLAIGPGGFGGPLTALGVAIEYAPTHIAGLPVAVSISCWADRKAVLSWEESYGV